MAEPKKYNSKDYVSADTGMTLSPGETIKVLRELNEWSQKDLEYETGMPQTTISAIENGRIALGADRAKVFANAFDVHPAVILFSDWKRKAA